ncbi:MAG: FMN-binding negative transcriptional regulator [Hyphomicrobiaceae bacterium]
MLYTPPAFRLDDLAALHDHMDRTGLAMIVTVGAEGPLISHVPLLLDRNEGTHGTLRGHLAKANPQIALSDTGREAVAVFPGPDAYVSPGWYATKREHGRVVPTWNYAVVHARGRLSFFEDSDRLQDVVDRLTQRHEAGRPGPWSIFDAPAPFIAAQLKGIVGFEISIERIEGKQKLSQNRSQDDRAGVVQGLEASEARCAHEIARLMRTKSQG